MDGEIKIYTKVWISVLASLIYCYFVSFNIPKGMFRLLSVLPIIYLFTVFPLYLTTVTLGGSIAFLVSWLANFKLLLFSFGQGPLSSNPSISLFHFIFIACFPIKIKNKQHPSPQIHTKDSSKSSLKFAIKVSVLAILSFIYEHKQHFNEYVMLPYYGCFMYVGLELGLATFATMARTLLGLELEPQFNEPYLSTSLQDFWGRRWNLMVTNILRPTVYLPIRFISTQILGRKWAQLPAVLITFVASGLMHEIMFYYIARASPTWEVTLFFVVHGILVVLEIVTKKLFKDKLGLHPIVSWVFTFGILMVTSYWLFFPQLQRCNTDVRISIEIIALLDFFKDLRPLTTISSTEGRQDI
ncbi:hypothetical protein IFM89_035905 [Coptis chinensis]|uniref:Wax synthase domain-containing protein n=1 Tax=Coptis chinensis TaxID=261450 RepID=A0A835LFI4_9MAGN|nr:hypothetical protein IFM89_035905 [Coptis chinensis]